MAQPDIIERAVEATRERERASPTVDSTLRLPEDVHVKVGEVAAGAEVSRHGLIVSILRVALGMQS